jgi:hypothetical protein
MLPEICEALARLVQLAEQLLEAGVVRVVAGHPPQTCDR